MSQELSNPQPEYSPVDSQPGGNTPQPQSAQHFYKQSPDVEELLAFARKLSRPPNGQPFSSSAPVSDRDILLALLLSNRLFNPIDAILKSAGVKPKVLLKSLNASTRQQPPQNELPSYRALEMAAHYAENDPDLRSDKIQLMHLILGLTHTSDPLLVRLMAEFRLGPEHMREAVLDAKRKNTMRMAMFFTRELAEVVIFVLFFLIVIRNLIGEPRLIPSESMVPTLVVEDRVLLERVSHYFRPYRHGDILVFYPPMTQIKQDPWSVFLRLTGFSGLLYKKEDNIDVAFIKRLIAEPGDLVDVRPGDAVYINGKRSGQEAGYTSEPANTCTLEAKFVAIPTNPTDTSRILFLGESGGLPENMAMWQFQQIEGALRKPKLIQSTPSEMRRIFKTHTFDYGRRVCLPVEVPQGHYFMMGDNRNESLDSRYWGFQPTDRVIGRAALRVWPLNRLGSIMLDEK